MPKPKLVTVYRVTRAYSTPYLNARSSHPLRPTTYVVTCEANSGSRGQYSNPWWSRLREGTWVNNGYLRGPAKMGIGDCPAPPNDGLPRGGRQGCDDCSPTTSTTSSDYATAIRLGFGGIPTGATRTVVDTSAKAREDGVVVVKFFIPNPLAAVGLLLGDNRSWSSDPATTARSRVFLTWDVSSGKASATVAPSVTNRLDPMAIPALRIPALRIARRESCGEVQSADFTSRDTNDFFVGSDGGRLRVCLSALNSVTHNLPFAVLSADGELSIKPTGSHGYHVAFYGNGYPAIESYYYPRTSNNRRTLFQRRIDPKYVGHLPDASGGLGAHDLFSKWYCVNRKTGDTRLQSICGFDPWSRVNAERQGETYSTLVGDRPDSTRRDRTR